MITSGQFGPLIGAIDEGTSSARFLVFAAKTAEVLTYHQIPITPIYPQEGWVEHCPKELLHAVRLCIEESIENLRKLDIDPGDIVATGLTNQRETTIVWDKLTGEPLYNAIVWLDNRTTETVDQLLSKIRKHNKDHLKRICGLPISTYFSAVKLKWLIDNVPKVKAAIEDNRCLFGTVDSWLIWNLTGGIHGGLHMTDVTNASRTMLMNLDTLKWDKFLCNFFGIPMNILPQIRSSSEIYGYIVQGALRNVPISGCLGDQQSALLGQNCLLQGQAKCTYGTGCFLLYNTGSAIIQSTHGLLSTVAYKLGPNAATVYALEGSVAVAGAAIQWLRDNLGIIQDAKESEQLAHTVSSCGDVYFVPAFSGLYAPYWRKDARSVICGLTDSTEPGHIIRAALESVCFQIHDILYAMSLDCSLPLSKLLVDGGMTNNDLLMQTQADLCAIPVIRPLMCETTALGCAMAAGMAEGVGCWEINNNPVPHDSFKPNITENQRDMRYSRWKMAVERSLGWEPEENIQSQWDGLINETGADKTKNILASIPASFYVITSFILLAVASKFR